MTNEGARRILIKNTESLKANPLITVDDCLYKAFDTAIKALEQQPCEDCISRQATINALWEALHEYENKIEKQFIDSEELNVADWIQHRVFVQNMSDIDRQTVLSVPSVTPQPKRGKWIPHIVNDKYESIDRDVCSECHTCFYGERTGDWKYCPNCGAKMESEE